MERQILFFAMIHHYRPGKYRITTLTVEEEEPVTLIDFLVKKLPGESKNSVKSLLARRTIFVDNKIITRHNYVLKKGQVVVVDKSIRYSGLKIIYEDSSLLIIDKEPGILSVPIPEKKETTALDILDFHVKKNNKNTGVYSVHRLDRETSGIMMFVKDVVIQEMMRNNWHQMISERKYIAVVEGYMEKEEGTLVSWLKEDTENKMYVTFNPREGKKAVTHYKVLKRNLGYSLLELELETGRKNQIRVQLNSIGHPIIGDTWYGAIKDPINRLGLHARVLEFIHPVTRQTMRFESPIPASFLSLF